MGDKTILEKLDDVSDFPAARSTAAVDRKQETDKFLESHYIFCLHSQLCRKSQDLSLHPPPVHTPDDPFPMCQKEHSSL